MANRRSYTVTVKHPTGFHGGVKTFTVSDAGGTGNQVYLTAEDFGCSRDYTVPVGFKGDCWAIEMFAAEHGCTVGSISADPK